MKGKSNPDPRKIGLRISTIFLYGFLLMAMYTFIMPAISITLPAFGKKSWSVHSVVRILPRDVLPRRGNTTDLDFKEFLEKILPKDAQSGQVKKVSVDFVLAALIPVALAVTYLLFLLNFFLAALPNGRFALMSSGLSVLSAAYTFLGTHFLGLSLKRRLAEELEGMNNSILGVVSKHFMKDTSIQPEAALYWLLVLSILVFFVCLFRRLQAR